MSNQQNYCNILQYANLVLLRLGLSEVAQNLDKRRGRPYTDTPCVGVLKSPQPIGDDPNLCMTLNLIHEFVRYSSNNFQTNLQLGGPTFYPVLILRNYGR